MKRFIKRLDKDEFYGDDGGWTGDVSKARVFPSNRDALEEQKRQGWTDVELYVMQHDFLSLADIAIPMPKKV
jgi:hypothetical protein